MSYVTEKLLPTKTVTLQTNDSCLFDVEIFESDISASRTILCFPAMGVMNQYYRYLASALCEAGFNVIVGELRGIGSHSLRASHWVDWGYADMVEQEWPAVVTCARQEFPQSSLCFLGHSIGGQISSLYLASHPEVSQELILIASNSMGFKGYGKYGFKILLFSNVIIAIARLLGFWPGDKLGLMGRQAKGEMIDWYRNTRTNSYILGKNKIDYESRFSEYKGRVLSISIEGDWHTPASSVISLSEKFTNASVSYAHLENIETPTGNIGHINWPRYPQKILPTILQWFEYESIPSKI